MEDQTRELPSGTITLMFTDIATDCANLGALGDEYRSLLNDHYKLILSSVEQHGGRLVATRFLSIKGSIGSSNRRTVPFP